MSKCLKIICCYFGERRDNFNTPKDMVKFIGDMVENEINIDNGIDTDVVLINNDIGLREHNSFLNSFHGLKTKNGEIIVERRENVDGSFGAYYDMAFKYINNYEYFFFCEDDVLIYKDQYMFEFVNFLNSDESLGFVSLAPLSTINTKDPLHSGGGCGLTSREKFLKVNPKQNVKKMSPKKNINQRIIYCQLQLLEIKFTNSYIRNGMRIENHPNFSPLCVNYKDHGGQKNYTNILLSDDKELEFIYRVGN